MSTSLAALAASATGLIPLDVPVGWSEPKDVNLVHAVLVLGGIPLVLFVAIAVAVYLPALIRGERIAPGAPPIENQWIGGPRQGIAELKGPASADAESGGASGRW